MVRTIRICVLWTVLFNLIPFHSECQSKDPLKLIDIIKTLSERHQVSFSYADEDLDSIKIEPPPPTLDLDKSIEYISNLTTLEFIFIDENSIAIRKRTIERICGFILDGEDDSPLANATILFKSKIILSDSSGYFEINEIKETTDFEIAIRYLGYQPLLLTQKEFQTKECQVFKMESQTAILKEVTITNYPIPGINKLSEGSFEVNTNEINILPGQIQPDVIMTLQSLPGVQSIDESVAEINIRGGSTDQTLLLWNDIRMYQNGHFFGLISTVNPYLTKQVTLTKNGSSARLGDGISGTVDIQSIDNSEALEAEAGINMLDADFIIKKPINEKSNLVFSARRSINDLITTPTYDKYFQRTFRNTEVIQNSSTDSLIASDQAFNFFDWSLTFSHKISRKNQLEINLLNASNTLDFKENEVINGTLTSRSSSLDNNSILGGINYDYLINPKLKLAAHSSISIYNLQSSNVDILSNQELLQENKVLDINHSIQVLKTFSPRWEFLNGYQFNEKGITNLDQVSNPQFRRLRKEVLKTHSLFSESTFITSSFNTTLRFGIRANLYQELEKITLEPRLSVSHKLNTDLTFEILAETKSQSSTQVVDLQNDFLGVIKRQWRLTNNEEIPLMMSKQLSTGMFYNIKDAFISIEAYYKNVEGIASQSQEFQNQFEFSRTQGSYRTMGIELLFKKDFNFLTTWLSYHLSQNRYRFKELAAFDFPSNYELNHFINSGISYTKNKFEISTGLTWFSGRPFTLPLTTIANTIGTIDYESPNDSNLPNYFRFDFSGKYNFAFSKIDRAQIGLSVWNIFNKSNILNTYYRLDENQEVERLNQLGLSFTPNLSVRIWM